jgi:hypothetical protein
MAHLFTNIEGLRNGVMLLGRYGANQCGGADVLNWKGSHAVIEQFVEQHAAQHHIMGEGSLMSQTCRYNRLGLRLRAANVDTWIGEMATPREECIARVIQRRQNKWQADCAKAQVAGKSLPPPPKPFNDSSLSSAFESVIRTCADARLNGLRVVRIESVPEAPQYVFNLMISEEARVSEGRSLPA